MQVTHYLHVVERLASVMASFRRRVLHALDSTLTVPRVSDALNEYKIIIFGWGKKNGEDGIRTRGPAFDRSRL